VARKKKPQGKPDYRMAWFLAALGVIAFGFGVWGAYNGAQTLKWPRAQAEIVDAKLTRHERETRDVQRPDKWHTFDVHYLYRVNGKTFLGGGIEPYAFNMQNSAGAQKMAEKYRIGTTAEVAYNPANGAEAYLQPGPSSFSLILIAIGIIFGLVALLARRMIRVGPGDDDEKVEPLKIPERSKSAPADVASFYPDRGKPPA
jgi:hypothetical protein